MMNEDKCRGCFGAANNDCEHCLTVHEEKNDEKNIHQMVRKEWLHFLQRFLRLS